ECLGGERIVRDDRVQSPPRAQRLLEIVVIVLRLRLKPGRDLEVGQRRHGVLPIGKVASVKERASKNGVPCPRATASTLAATLAALPRRQIDNTHRPRLATSTLRPIRLAPTNLPRTSVLAF